MCTFIARHKIETFKLLIMLPLIAAAIPSVFQGITGAIQAGKGRRMAENNIRPTYNRPKEATEALALSSNNYLNSGMPGKNGLVNQIGSANANALDMATQAASSGGDVLDAITKLNYNEQQQLNQVAAQEAQFKDAQLKDYQNQLGIAAGYSDKEFAYNKDQPYQDRAAAASSLIEAGNTNVGSGLNGLSTLATASLLGGEDDEAKNDKLKLAGLKKFGGNAAANAAASLTGKKIIYDPYGKKLTFQ